MIETSVEDGTEVRGGKMVGWLIDQKRVSALVSRYCRSDGKMKVGEKAGRTESALRGVRQVERRFRFKLMNGK